MDKNISLENKEKDLKGDFSLSYVNLLVENLYKDMEELELKINERVKAKVALQGECGNYYSNSYEEFKEIMQKDKEKISIYFNQKLAKFINEISLNLYDVPYEYLYKSSDKRTDSIINKINELIPIKDAEKVIYGLRSFREYKNEGAICVKVTPEIMGILMERADEGNFSKNQEKVIEKLGFNEQNLDRMFFIRMEDENN